MNKVQILGFFFNLIIYFFMIFPIIILSLKKEIYNTKNSFCFAIIISFVIEIILSAILYIFNKSIFSIFSNTSGIINYAVYSSKIFFISSSLYGIKILIPAYIFHQKTEFQAKKISNKKKSAILFLSKIAVNVLLILIGYNLFNTKGILYSFPVCDLIFYIIYIIIFLNIIRNNF